MLSTIALVVAGLSTVNKIGIAAVGAAFIAFALVSSLLLPRRNPNFPGRGMGWYVVLCVLFFVAMLSAVLVFGRESEEATGTEPEPPAATSTVSGSLPGQTTSTPTTTANSGGGDAPTEGDSTAGRAVFASAGCGGCHTLKAAGSSGNVGPNLDSLKPAENTVEHQVEHGGRPPPAHTGAPPPRQ